MMLAVSCVMAQELTTGPVKFSVTLRGDWTDNRDSLAGDAKESTADFYVKPRMDYHGDWNRSFLDFYYAPAYRYRTDPGELQHENSYWHDAYVGGEYSLQPGLTLRAMDKFDYSDDPSVSEGGLTVRRDDSFVLNRVEAGVNYEITDLWVADALGRYLDKNFKEDIVAEDSDETRADGQLTLTRHMGPGFDVFAKGLYSDFAFESSTDLDRDFTTVLAAIGMQKYLNQQILVGVSAGAQMQHYEDPTIDAETVPYGNVWVRGSTVPSLRLLGEYTHALRDADAYPYASQIYDEVIASVELDVAPRTMLGLRAEYRLSDYGDQLPSGGVSVATGEPGGEETRVVGEASVTYKLSPVSRIILDQRYEDVDSDVATSFTKNTTKALFGRDF